MDEITLMSYAAIEAIKAEIEGAKLDNKIREMQGLDTFNYSPEYFFEKSKELKQLATYSPQFLKKQSTMNTADKRTTDDIIEAMGNEMPYEMYEKIIPYVKEAISIFANQEKQIEAIAFSEWVSKEEYKYMEFWDVEPQWLKNEEPFTTNELYQLYINSKK